MYDISEDARNDFKELFNSSLNQIAIDKEIDKLAKMGEIIEVKNGFEVRRYIDILFVIKGSEILYLYREEN